ncbi:MAG: hypothetical protein KJ000_00960 [Pirellulaceae bacterium]|nr:hypothetical protein [Pirellulaceae bacterium]
MPVVVHADVRRPSQEEFAEISYDVMHHLFAIHNEFGRFLREEIYKQELAARRAGLQLEVPIDVSFGRFVKRYEIDLLADQSAVFELKTVEALARPSTSTVEPGLPSMLGDSSNIPVCIVSCGSTSLCTKSHSRQFAGRNIDGRRIG